MGGGGGESEQLRDIFIFIMCIIMVTEVKLSKNEQFFYLRILFISKTAKTIVMKIKDFPRGFRFEIDRSRCYFREIHSQEKISFH